MPENKVDNQNNINPNTVQLGTAEKTVVKFLDARIDGDASKMRSVMTENFQGDYDFSVLDPQKPIKSKPVSFRLIRTSKEAGSVYVTAEVLMQKIKNHKQKAVTKVYDLVKADDNKTYLINSEKTTNAGKPWYKRFWPWLLIVLGLLIIASLIVWFFVSRKATQNQNTIANSWHDLVEGANTVETVGNRVVSDKKDYSNYTSALQAYSKQLSDKKFQADQLSVTAADKKDIENYKNALSNLSDYISKAASQSESIATYSSADSSSLNDLANSAKNAVDNFQNNAKFLHNKMPDSIFEISDTLDKIKDQIDEDEQKAQEAKDAAAAAAAKDAADKTTVTNNVNTFENGFIAGNANQMRPVMTTGFQGEYNFNQLSQDQRQYQYPSSFRVISINKQPDGNYKAQVNVLYKYTDNPNQYTQGYEYSVISQNGKWLINDEKVSNGF